MSTEPFPWAREPHDSSQQNKKKMKNIINYYKNSCLQRYYSRNTFAYSWSSVAYYPCYIANNLVVSLLRTSKRSFSSSLSLFSKHSDWYEEEPVWWGDPDNIPDDFYDYLYEKIDMIENSEVTNNNISISSIDASQKYYKRDLVCNKQESKQYFDISSIYPYNPLYIDRKDVNDKSLNKKHKVTGLNTKIGINVWYRLNFAHIDREELQPNLLFMEEFKGFVSDKFKYEHYYYHELYHFKENEIIRNKIYYGYLINTPNSIIKNCIDGLVWSYYRSSNPSIWNPNSKNLFVNDKKGYGIISLYHQLGVDLVERMFDVSYSNYLDDNQIRYYRNRRGKPLLTTNKPFLSYVDYKNRSINNEYNFLDTKSLVEYGRDMYLFFIFITWISLSNRLIPVEDLSNNHRYGSGNNIYINAETTTSKGVMKIRPSYDYEEYNIIKGKFFSENMISRQLGSYPYNEKLKVEHKEDDKVLSNSKNNSLRILTIKYIDNKEGIILRTYIYHIYDNTQKDPLYSRLSPSIDRRLKVGIKWIWTDPNAIQLTSKNKKRSFSTYKSFSAKVFPSSCASPSTKLVEGEAKATINMVNILYWRGMSLLSSQMFFNVKLAKGFSTNTLANNYTNNYTILLSGLSCIDSLGLAFYRLRGSFNWRYIWIT